MASVPIFDELALISALVDIWLVTVTKVLASNL
jgi:hypothetical protein